MEKKYLYIFGGIIFLTLVLYIIFGPKINSPGENVVFIGEEVNLHQDYLIKVISVNELDTIEILASPDDTEKISISSPDKHYIAVQISIKRQNTNNPDRDHTFDRDDFKLKDHTGVKLKNLYIQSIEDGTVLSNTEFNTTKAYQDYSWVDHSLNPGDEILISVYFEVDKNLSVFSDFMILESDFFWGRGDNLGVDILLAAQGEE